MFNQPPRFPMFGMPPQQFDSSATPFQFGGFNYFPQQEPVPQEFSIPMSPWNGQDAGFNAGPDLSGIDLGFSPPTNGYTGAIGPDEDPGFNAGNKQPKRPPLIPELQDHDHLPEDGGPDQYPDFLDFMRQANPWGDIGIKAAILARSFTNPEQATQWAMALKQQEAQRMFQAQQAQQQQASVRENIKLRSQYQKEQKNQTKMQSRIQKLDASVRSAKINPDPIIEKLGPPDEDNIDQWEREIQREVARVGSEEKVKKDKDKILSQALKSQIEAPQFTDENKPGYDPVFARNLEAANSLRSQKEGDEKIRHNNINRLNELRADLLKARIRVENGTLTDTEKAELKSKYEEMDVLRGLMEDAAKQASSIDLFAGNTEEGTPQWAAAQEKYQYSTNLVNRRMQELQDKIFEIKDFIGQPRGKGITPNPTRALPGTQGGPKTDATTGAATGAAAGAPQPGKASDKAKANFKAYAASGQYTPEQLRAAWQKQFPGEPFPE